MTLELTDEERHELAAHIGIALTEIGTNPEGPILSACRKLGIVPFDWNGEPVLMDGDDQ